MRAVLLGALAALTAQAALAEGRLTEPAIRAFVARQEAAWNGRDARAWAASFTPDAVFVDQAKNSNGGITSNGSSPLADTAARARRFFAHATFEETAVVDRIEIAPDGRSARVFGHETSRIQSPGRGARTLCAQTEQTLVLLAGRLRSQGQIDTDVRCPR